MEALGPFLRELREQQDISLREFAKKLDCSAAFVSDIELGKRHPSDEVLAEMARILGVPLEKLRERDTRAPIEDIKSITQADPRYALAFRTMVDNKITADDLLKFVQSKGPRTKSKG